MYYTIGLQTKKVYTQGTRADCLRELNRMYPYFIPDKNHSQGRQTVDTVHPEVMVIRKG